MAREYKDSGIEWIGLIPKEWKICLTSSLFHEHKEKNIGLKNTNLLSLSYGKIKRKDINTNEGLLPQSFETYNVIKEGDIVFRLTDLQNDKRSLRTGLCEEDGIITSAYVTLRANNAVYCTYFHYLFHSYDECKVFYGLGDGVRQGMNWVDVKNLVICEPPFYEQQKIADYLDKVCGEADEMIALQEKMIEELKAYKQSIITEAVTKGLNPNVPMKNSCIDWIGEMPKHWNLIHFYKINWIRARLGWKGLKADEYTETGYPFLSAFNIINDKLIWEDLNFINQNRYDESPEIKLSTGDLLLVKDGAGIGKCAVVDELPFGEATVNSSLAVVSPNSEIIDSHFQYYYFKSAIFQNTIWLLKIGMGVPHLTQENMRDIVIPNPPLSEQQSIASYLDTKCSEIDSLIAIKQQKIAELKEYKKSVIYEYVTGKKEVI